MADRRDDERRFRGAGDLPEHEGHGHYNLAGLHDLDDLSELRERYREQRRQRDFPPLPMGRGPKRYQRSDDRIREDICDRLMMSWMDAERVDVLVRDGEVTLQGLVRTRDEKRAIEALAESVLGVKDVHNTLRVDRGGQTPERRAQDQEQAPAQKPGDTPLHS